MSPVDTAKLIRQAQINLERDMGMASLNRVTIIGNVGKEPEMRFTPNGAAVTSFSVATNESYVSDGDKQERTEWFNVVAWKKLAETCNQFLDKGSKIYVDGRQQTRKWQDNEGKDHYRTELVASRVLFLSPKSETAEVETLEPEDIPF